VDVSAGNSHPPLKCTAATHDEDEQRLQHYSSQAGESGTGKELVARQIRDLSRRRKGPFVAVNCAAIVETLLEAKLFGIEDRTATGVRGRRGKFEHAHEGTLFLDEVSDLSPAAQAKLLRAIQDLSVERVGGCPMSIQLKIARQRSCGRIRRTIDR
jgi:transcriptional regulator with PAS, ATPase and Fis domain